MTKAEIHFRFMEAAIQGLSVRAFDPHRGHARAELGDEYIASRAKYIADEAVEAYLSRWPDLKLEG